MCFYNTKYVLWWSYMVNLTKIRNHDFRKHFRCCCCCFRLLFFFHDAGVGVNWVGKKNKTKKLSDCWKNNIHRFIWSNWRKKFFFFYFQLDNRNKKKFPVNKHKTATRLTNKKKKTYILDQIKIILPKVFNHQSIIIMPISFFSKSIHRSSSSSSSRRWKFSFFHFQQTLHYKQRVYLIEFGFTTLT